MNIEEIKKIIKLNGVFEAIGKVPVSVTDFGNIQSAYSHVIVGHNDGGYYSIRCFVVNEWGEYYSELGETTISLSSIYGCYISEFEFREGGKTFTYEYFNKYRLPSCFSKTAKKYVKDLIWLLKKTLTERKYIK